MTIMKLRNRIFAVILVLSIVVFGALSATSAHAQTTDGFDRMRIERAVRKQLVTLPYYGVFDNLAFKVDGATVTLLGQALRPTTRSGAENRVKRIAGVERVVNNIEVLPLSNFDDRIRAQAYRAIFNTGGLYRYALGANPSLHIVVNRGHVTLEGVVGTKGDKTLAYHAARSIPGVFSVTNNLRAERGERVG